MLIDGCLQLRHQAATSARRLGPRCALGSVLGAVRNAAVVAACAMTVLAVVATTRAAAELQLGGNVGFGMTLRKQAGLFAWDWDSSREDTTLAELKLRYLPVSGVAAFVRFGARLEAAQGDEAPRFALRQAALVVARAVGADSLGVRLFALEPNALWLDHGLGAPLDPHALGDDVQGARAALYGSKGLLMLLAADGSGRSTTTGVPGADAQVILVRLRGDPGRAGLRLGATYMRAQPAAASEVRAPRDQFGVDLRACVAGIQAQLDYTVMPGVDDELAPSDGDEASGNGGWMSAAIQSHAALRAELRAPRLGTQRWGWFGFAPSYRVIGADHTNLFAPALLEPGSPRRGVEGYRLEGWYGLPGWPLWLRHAYDRHLQYQDAARRIIRQESEVEALLAADVGARLRYVQRQVRDEVHAGDAYHDDLLAELRAAHGATRLRLQWAALDLHAATRRDAFALEAGMRLSARLHFLARTTWARAPVRAERSFTAELQYWHLPQFELALQYGAGWIGDRADPALDADVMTAAGRDLLRLHLRGWF